MPSSRTSRARRRRRATRSCRKSRAASASGTSTDSKFHDPSSPAALWMWRARCPTTTSLPMFSRTTSLPMWSCSSSANVAEIRHLAEHRDRAPVGRRDLREGLQRGRRRVRAGVVCVIDHDDRRRRGAAPPSATVPPWACASMAPIASAIGSIPSWPATLSAARAFMTWCSPRIRTRLHPVVSPCSTRVNEVPSMLVVDLLGAEVGCVAETEPGDAGRGHARPSRRPARRPR